MLICELFETFGASAVDQLLHNAGKMHILYADTLVDRITRLYGEGNHSDMYRTAKTVVGRTKGKWFGEYYLSTSSRRNSPNMGIKNALVSISKDPTYQNLQPELNRLASLEIYANAEQRMKYEASFGKHTTQLESLPIVMQKMVKYAPDIYKNRLSQVALKLDNAINNFYSLWEKLHKEWDEEWGEAAPPKIKDKKTSNNIGAQYDQIETIVNQVLSSLPNKIANDIRISISRADNKLTALQNELQKRKINI
ncbi:MAG: hypothetical protein ACXW2E_01100 [Nitrososphaeraceae archaeon]